MGGIPSRMRSSPTQMPSALLPPTGFNQDIPNMRPNNIPMNENGTNVHTVDACQLLCHGVESGFLFISGVPGHSCKCGSFTKVKLTFWNEQHFYVWPSAPEITTQTYDHDLATVNCTIVHSYSFSFMGMLLGFMFGISQLTVSSYHTRTQQYMGLTELVNHPCMP